MSDDNRVVEFRRKDLAGSRLRCLMLTSGSNRQVAERLNALVQPFARLDSRDIWMPRGFLGPDEARLEKAGLLPHPLKNELRKWWLAVPRGANTPNWDIAARATIKGRKGLLLVEAKAHESELDGGGKKQDSKSNRANHMRIEKAIGEARAGLDAVNPGWGISPERKYQLSNRFAWCWKLAEMGVPVVLVYLGFLNADEMPTPFRTHKNWEGALRNHAAGIVPDVWGKTLAVKGTPFTPLIRSLSMDWR